MNQRTNSNASDEKRKFILVLRSNLNMKIREIHSSKQIHEINAQQNTENYQDNQLSISPDKFSIESPLLSKRFNSAGRTRKPVTILSQYNKPFKMQVLQNKIGKSRRSGQSVLGFGTKNDKSEMYSTATSIKKIQKVNPHVTAQSYLIMLRKNKKIVLGHKIDIKRQIASITKLMTALTVLHLCKIYEIELSSTLITVQQQAAQIQGTSAGLHQGDQLNVLDLLYGMFLPSGNDAAIALAQHFGKFLSFVCNSQQMRNQESRFRNKQIQQYYDNHYNTDSLKLFVFKMNNFAFQLGLTNSHFQNPTGLQDIHSYSTAQDVAKISSLCIENGTLRTIMERKTYNCTVYNLRLCSHKIYTWKNTNKLLWRRRECFGLKTGNTPWAGACLTATFNIQNQDVIIVVLKSSNPQERFNDAERLYSWYKRQHLLHQKI